MAIARIREVFSVVVADPVLVRAYPTEMRVMVHGEKFEEAAPTPETFRCTVSCSGPISVAGIKILRALLAAAIDEAK